MFEIFTAIVADADVQMRFSPEDERSFVEALRAGQFDAKAVCSTLDARKATATVEADKAMITARIEEQLSIQSYNQRLRRFLEGQYRLTAMRGRRNDAGADGRRGSRVKASGSGPALQLRSGEGAAGEFAEVLKHLQRMHQKIEALDRRQQVVEGNQQVLLRSLGSAAGAEGAERGPGS